MPKNNNELAAIYVRVSSTKTSQKDSPEHQKGVCEEKAHTLSLDILSPHYEDRDTGTSIVARSSIQKLIEDAKNGLFSTVIFASLSRFSRDQLDALTLKRTLVDALGIRVISIDENFDSRIDTDEFKFQVLSAVNQKLSEQISLSSRRGIKQSAKKGNFTGSKAPYGYKKVVVNGLKTLTPDSETCETLKSMFNMYISGMGDKAIVNYLNEKQIPSYTGKLWGVSSVKSILQNPIYCGQAYFGKYRSKKVYHDINNVQDRSSKLFAVNKSEWELSENTVFESLIDEKTFELSLDVRKKRNNGVIRRGGARAKSSIFAGLLFCDHCNSPMNVVGSTVKGKEYRYIKCSTIRRLGINGCQNTFKSKYSDFQDKMIDQIKIKLREVLNRYKTESFADKLHENISKSSDKEVKRLEKTIEENRKLLQGIRKLFLLEEIDEDQYRYEKTTYEQNLEKAQKELTLLEENKNSVMMKSELLEEIEKHLKHLMELEINSENIEEANLLLKSMITKIIINDEGEVKITSILGDI